jgi:hypothetical protein
MKIWGELVKELGRNFLIAIIITAIVVAVHLNSKAEAVPEIEYEVVTKGHPVEYAERPIEEVEDAWIAYDTPEEDAADDNFEMLVSCCFAEAGNQPETGIRLVVDTIGNRAGWDMAKVDDVITSKNQFESYPCGMEKWQAHITEEFIHLVADEWQATTKACGSVNVWYFRTSHYSPYGTPWQKVGAHYFSIKEDR